MTDDLLLLLAEIESIKPKLLLASAEQSQTDRLAVDSGNGRNAHIDVLITRLQIHAPILRQSAFGDVHVRHYFQARDNGRLQDAQLRWHSDFVQNPIDSIPNPQIVFERLNVNIGRTLQNRLTNDLVDEFHYGSLGIVGVELDGGFGVLQHLERAVRFQDFIERFRADAIEGLDCAQQLGTGHQHPLSRLFQQLRRQLTAYGIKEIVGREHHRVFLYLNGQDMVLKNKAAGKNRQCSAIRFFSIGFTKRPAG